MAAPTPEIRIELPDTSALFDDTSKPAFPHTTRMLDSSISDYLVSAAREHRRAPAVALRVVSRQPPLAPNEEGVVREEVRNYFREEGVLASQAYRVNRAEGRGSMESAVPLLLLAALVAFALYAIQFFPAAAEIAAHYAYLLALLYLVFITIVWVTLWDPIEKIWFDGYLARLQVRAIDKLSAATVQFEYRTSPSAVPSASAEA